MFDREFFRDKFQERVVEFAKEHGVKAVTVNVVTHDRGRYDIQAIHSGDHGARLITLDGVMVFLPYREISRVEVSAPKGKGGPLGFQVPPSP